MNIREFSRLCGVSPAAASRILNRSLQESQASPETYERVRKLADEVGYRPNYAAKALHTHKSHYLGVIIGFPTPINTTAMVKGICAVAYQNDYLMSIATCDNNPQKEVEAFKSMLYRGADAIIWHPTIQKGAYSTSHVEQVLANSRKRIPVVCLSCNNMPGIFRFCPNSEETVTEAALRQLRAGCRRFGLLLPSHRMPMMDTSARTYRQTLLQEGVPAEHIVDVQMGDARTDFSLLRGVEGLWTSYIPLLHMALKHIQRYCDVRTLHVDGQSFIEDYTVTRVLFDHLHNGFESQFASLHWQLLDGTRLAERAAEIALEAINNPGLAPFTEQIEWQIATQAAPLHATRFL